LERRKTHRTKLSASGFYLKRGWLTRKLGGSYGHFDVAANKSKNN
jgi:hypothetical protein